MASKKQIDEVMTVFTNLTGLNLDDVLKEVLAENPEEQEKAKVDNVKKMFDHIRGPRNQTD